MEPSGESAKPRLIYDGDCGFCAYWARYWQALTGERVEYRTYQDVAAQHPEIPVAEFQHAVQYLGPGGRRARAAEASFLTLSHAPGRGLGLALYRRLPGFAFVAERSYAFIAARRTAFYRLSLLLWGRDPQPPRYELVAELFVRLFGLTYLAAFVSFAVQAQGLIGSHGILPLGGFLDAVRQAAGPQRFFLMPMLFWWDASDQAIALVCWGGAALSVLVTLKVFPRLCLLLLHVLYLSLLYAGQVFMTYQWDTFLLETGFLALLLTIANRPGIWLLRWLLFRFMFMSGVVKLASGDPNWWNLSALSYHFMTQPLPTPLAWYAAHLPHTVLELATAATFVVELLLPFLIFCPRRLHFLAAGGILLLQTGILLTGNYNWFNLQTMLLCVPLLDDAALSRILPARLRARFTARSPAPPAASPGTLPIAVSAVGALLVFVSLIEMDARFGGTPPAALRALDGFIEPLHLTSPYGLFSVMTTKREEIVIEGSADGIEWREYEFRYKPGDLRRRPPWNIPHQPRLDWQMWFAALDDPRRLRWFWMFLEKLLRGEPTVTALLLRNPFPDRPPRYIRAKFYDYTYSAAQARGQWWDRRLLGLYFPEVQLKID